MSKPIFLINRERALAAQDPTGDAVQMARRDIVGLALLVLAFTAYIAVTFVSRE